MNINNKKIILNTASQSSKLISEINELSDDIIKISSLITKCLKNNNKIIIFGNGGSATDADHFATELLGRFELERQSLPAIALTNSGTITAIGNDYGFENIFSRQCESLVAKNDISIGISTSGNSPNVIQGIKQSKKNKAKTIGITGNKGGKLTKFCDINIVAPSTSTPRIQEVHRVVIHIICDLVERSFKEI